MMIKINYDLSANIIFIIKICVAKKAPQVLKFIISLQKKLYWIILHK